MVLKELVFKFKLLLRGGRSDLSESLKWSGKPIDSDKWEIAEWAFSHCPFYTQLYNHVDWASKDWNTIPILEKSMIRENAQKILNPTANTGNLNTFTTGGSTGTPLQGYKDNDVHYEVLGWRALSWYHIFPWDNVGIVHRNTPVTFRAKIMNRLLWWPTKRAYLNATSITKDKIQEFINDIVRQKVRWIVGYCGSLENIADYILDNQIEINGLKVVWSTSSPLTKTIRNKLQQAFNCPVMDQYGCCEMGNIAIQKPLEDYLTVNSDYVHVDIVDENNNIISEPDKEGDILITDLRCKSFPLIKYRLGDRSSWASVQIESSDLFPKMNFVQGRITDSICLPDGSKINGEYLTTVADNFTDEILSYQIHQHLNYSVKVLFVVSNPNSSAPEQIVNNLRNISNNQIAISHELVNYIPNFAGKRRFIISDIALKQKS